MTPRKPSDRIFASPALRVQSDRRLVTLAREGSEAAVEEIVRRYRPALVRYAALIVPPDKADDVVQDSLARALPGIGSGESDLHLRPWLYTIVRNTALNALRDAGPPHEQLDENYDGVEQPPQAMERREQVRSLVAGLWALPEPQREALVKREMEGRSHAEIGAEMGVSTGAARQLIFRARNALRDGIGSLVPMPVLRHFVESGDGGGAVATAAAGGGAVGVKATLALVATGAVVTAGVAIQHSDHHAPATAAVTGRHGGYPKETIPISAGPSARHTVAREVADRSKGRGSTGSTRTGGDSHGSVKREGGRATSGGGSRHGAPKGHGENPALNDGPHHDSGSSGLGGHGGESGSGPGEGSEGGGSNSGPGGDSIGSGGGPGPESGSGVGGSGESPDEPDGGGSGDSGGGTDSRESSSGGSRDSRGGEVLPEVTD